MDSGPWGNASIQALPLTPDSEVSPASALGVQGAVFPEPLGSFFMDFDLPGASGWPRSEPGLSALHVPLA